MTRPTAELMIPPAGAVTDASGVAQTAAVAATVIANVPKNAIGHILNPSRRRPRDCQPFREYPSRVTTSSMIKVARTGVIDQTAPQANSFEASPQALIARAAATAKINTSPLKMAALLVSVSVLNIAGPPA